MSKKPFVLVTGATAGIGRHASLYLAERGFHVIATGRNPAALAELSGEGNGDITPLRLDVNDAASIASAVEVVERITGGHGVDVLVNNAGYGELAPVEMVDDADLRAQFETNVFGLMAVTRAFLPRMRERGEGRIINVSSLGGLVTMPLFGAYSASKYAVEALSDALRIELRPFGIRVSIIEPGPVKSGFTKRSVAGADKYLGDDSPYAALMKRFIALTPRSDRLAPGPIVTSRAIHRAATSRRPRARYRVVWFARASVVMVKVLPTSWSDALMRRIVHLTPKHVGPGATAKTPRAFQRRDDAAAA
ncbi:MAG TPA: SDR family oxidoreductase [Kofleriaceae bacterium]|nr:SDR family oxidoreductase [Kofleriaceae bacterium]